jgi:uncharacterized damage-inducible protein DinB
MNTLSMNFSHFFDYLVKARGRLHEWVGAQPSEVYTRQFGIGLGSIRATLVHTAAAEWAYVERLAGRDVSLGESPFTVERQPEYEPFAEAWRRRALVTRQALSDLGDPVRAVEWTSYVGPKPMRVRATAGGIAGQMLFHEVHHRAQVMAMLRQVGVVAENLDYSVLIWDRIPID